MDAEVEGVTAIPTARGFGGDGVRFRFRERVCTGVIPVAAAVAGGGMSGGMSDGRGATAAEVDAAGARSIF